MKIKDLNNYDNGMKNFTIQIVSVGELHDFSNQPFKVKNDLEMFELMKSIETYGVLVPAEILIQSLEKTRNGE